MSLQDNFGLLRTILRALGLSPEAVDDIVSRILDLLGARDQKVRSGRLSLPPARRLPLAGRAELLPGAPRGDGRLGDDLPEGRPGRHLLRQVQRSQHLPHRHQSHRPEARRLPLVRSEHAQALARHRAGRPQPPARRSPGARRLRGARLRRRPIAAGPAAGPPRVSRRRAPRAPAPASRARRSGRASSR